MLLGTQPNQGANGDQQAVPPTPFVEASRRRVELMDDRDVTFGTTSNPVRSIDVTPLGFLANLYVTVDVSGGSGATTAAVAAEDAPFNVLQDVSLEDVDGNDIYGPLSSGYLCYLAEKYGGYSFMSDAKQRPSWTAMDAGGNFTFSLRIPIQLSDRDALGALTNGAANQTYKLNYTVAPRSTVYDTEPDTPPTSVRIRAEVELWNQPQGTGPTGNPQDTEPPFHGTTQHWVESVFNIGSGQQIIRLSRVGNFVRTLVMVLEDTNGARTTTDFPDPIRQEIDGNLVHEQIRRNWRDRLAERYGYVAADDAANGLETGVLVYTLADDVDGHPGFEDRKFWQATSTGTKWDVRGNFGANTSKLTVLTNDVAVPQGLTV